MKRHSALIPLSREHQGALILAQRLKSGVSSNPKYPWPVELLAQRDKVLEMFKVELLPHFVAEESCFFEPLQGQVGAQTAALIAEVLNEHQVMRQMIQALENPGDDLAEQLQAFGQYLEDHVHKEERELFQRLQTEVPEAILQVARQELEAQYVQRPPFYCVFTGELKTPELD